MSNKTHEKEIAKELTEKQKGLAAYNNPVFSENTFELGDRKFTVLHLQYDDYNEFVMLLAPLLTNIATTWVGNNKINLPGIGEIGGNPGDVLKTIVMFCIHDLPQLVALICNTEAKRSGNTEALVDQAWVRAHASTPIQLALIVMQQIAVNKFIAEIGAFFDQCLPLFQKVKSSVAQ